jgi:hypothetical protein
MAKTTARTKRKNERGMALLLTLFALLLLSAVGLFLVVASNTETRIDANYGSGLRTYYSARSGLEEVRDRIKTPYSTSTPWGLADKLPQDIAGNPGGVLYVVNPASGETVDPTNTASPYFDDDLCHQYNSGTPKGIKCTTVPGIKNWQLPPQASLAAAGQLNYKWIRINMKTNRAVLPSFCVDQQQDCSTAPLDTRVCWDGKTEQVPPVANSSCDANGMQTVYMLTALAVSHGASGPNGARKLLQVEVVAPSIRPAGAVTASSLNVPTSTVIPAMAMDGRVHRLDGTLATNPDGTVATISGCSPISALATDTGASQLSQALNQMRMNIVATANSSCYPDGSSIGSNKCTPGLAWVRGTSSTPRFSTGTSTSGFTSGPSGSDGGSSGSDGGHDGSKTSGGSSSLSYTNLDLSAPQLYGLPAGATAQFGPFIGRPGNQTDPTVYQPAATQTVGDEITAVRNLVAAGQSQANYFSVSPAGLGVNNSFGSSDPNNPSAAVVVDSTTDTSTVFSIPANTTLIGTGVLVVSNALEVYGTLKWNGIVLVNSPTGHVTIAPNAQGFINGALLLAPGATFNFPGGSAGQSGPSFNIRYSCDAIDLPFSPLPFKVVASAETSN